MRSISLSSSTAIQGDISLPASKSISNRALILHALNPQSITFSNLSNANDTLLLMELLEKIKRSRGSMEKTNLNCQNAGTVLRFLTAFLSITPGKWHITGSDRMKERPIGGLVETLKDLGANIAYVEKTGFPSLLIEGRNLLGGSAQIDASISSQFISAILLISPGFERGLSLKLNGKISSRPYIDMTITMLKQAGVEAVFSNNSIHVSNQKKIHGHFAVEPDWSSAIFWYELVSFAQKANILLLGMDKTSIQGDAVMVNIYEKFGIESRFENKGLRLLKRGNPVKEFLYDFSDHPDLAQAIIATCAGLGINGEFTGLESLKIKETDRLKAMVSELNKLGYNTFFAEDPKSHEVIFQVKSADQNGTNSLSTKPVIIDPFGDHRMAMAFAPFVLIFMSLRISDPEVVSKSYPKFWDDLKKSGIKIATTGD